MRNIEQQPKQEDVGNQEISKISSVEKEKEEELDNLFSPIEQAENIHKNLAETVEQIQALSQSIAENEGQISVIRENLGMSKSDETPHSIVIQRENLEKLQNEKSGLEQQIKKFTSSEEVVEIESDIPKDVLKRFDVSKILEHGREKFAAFLKNVNLRTLIGYIEAGGIKLSKVEEIPNEWKKKIKDTKQQTKELVMINPKLYFLSKDRCAEIALKELLARITGGTDKET